MPIPSALSNFDIANAIVSVWFFKRSTGAGGTPVFTGRWIETNADLDAALKEAVAQERAHIAEVIEYSLLAQNNEGSALRIGALETHAGLILEQVGGEVSAKKISKLKQIQNTDFYVIKMTNQDNVLHAIRRTDASWQSKKAKTAISVFFEDDQLGLDVTPSFNISRQIDFFIVDDEVIISHKGNFESVLSYKQAHAEDFAELQAEPEFAALFTSLDALIAFVGSNKIHLRRACAIRQKAHYKNEIFMANLRQHHTRCGLSVAFDDQGRISPTAETCADIVTALLDHRLLSAFSENVYDVPATTIVT